jgi:hypothetical protein
MCAGRPSALLVPQWPTASFGRIGAVCRGARYFTANQLHRQPDNQLHRQPDYHDGKALRVKPYSLFRVKTEGSPLRLR